MFRNIKDYIMNIVCSRLFLLLITVLILFGFLIQRLFSLQIINGESYQDNFKLKIRKEKSIASTRGNIYDRKGNVLAYDELAYSVTIEDNYDSGTGKNAALNATILRLINIIEDNGNKLVNDFDIVIDDDGRFVYTLEDKALLRFLADVYGHTKTDELKYKEKTATPDEVMNYLAGKNKFGIGEYTDADKKNFVPGRGYTKEELLKIVTIRYAMSANSFQKYISTTVATGVSEKTVAVVTENKDVLQGVDITEDTVRKYIGDKSLSHILGYTGKISQTELDELGSDGSDYVLNDVVGKAGIEKVMEKELQGTKGSKTVYVDNLGKVIETSDEIEPVAGNDLHLTIDADLQKAIYDIIEQKLAGILVSKIQNVKEYTPSANDDASKIIIPIDDVYFALFNNNVIDINHLGDNSAAENEKAVYQSFLTKQDQVLRSLREELVTTGTPYTGLTLEMQVYESFITSMLSSQNTGVLSTGKIDTNDEIYLAWKNETISLKEYLMHAIAMNWIDITKIEMDSQYSNSDEIYNALVDYIINNLKTNKMFSKKVIKYMIRDNNITGTQICMIMYEQKVILGDESEKAALASGTTTAYSFIMDKISNLEITPAELALDPCSGSSVVIDTKTGEVLACVSYPSYDNNRLANTIDADYYNALNNDLSLPLYNYATQQQTAPGSTFKMISSVAALEEGVVTLDETINCLGTYEFGASPPKCWISPSKHGPLDIRGAIQNSCNYFFFEVGYRLSLDSAGKYDSEIGLNKLAEYAKLFGLSDTSGIELTETSPNLSTQDSVRSAIGQGTHNYTTVGLARYVNTVANSGVCYNISVLDTLTDSSGNILKDYNPTIRNNIDVASSTWDAVHEGMRGVVENSSAFENFPIAMAGKTGTAQQIKTRPNHALFVGYAPYNNPEIAIATRIAYGYTSANAAEVSRDIVKYYFNPEDAEEIITGEAATPDSVIAGD